MSDALETRAEIVMLSRLLGREPDRLAYLEELGPEGLREVRRATTDLLFDGDRSMFVRLAAGSKLLPTAALATIAERAFGPLLCARIAGYIEPARAVEVAAKLSPAFLADVAVEIDPRKARTVIGRIPAAQAAAVAEILTARDEFVTMGRFVGHLEDDAIRACLEVIPDRKLLPVAFVMEEKQRLDHVMSMLSPERAADVARDAAAAGHWAEALDLAEHVSTEQAGRLADVVAETGEEVLTSLVEAATETGLWPDLLPVSRAMSPRARERFARVEAIQRPEVLEQMVRATIEHDLWRELLPLVSVLPEEAQLELARIAGRIDGAVAGAVRAAIAHDLWAELVTLVPTLEPESQSVVAVEVAALPPERLRELIAAVSDDELWMPLITIATRLDGETQVAMVGLLAEADSSVLEGLIVAIDSDDAWEQLGALTAAVPASQTERLVAEAERLGLGQRAALILGD